MGSIYLKYSIALPLSVAPMTKSTIFSPFYARFAPRTPAAKRTQTPRFLENAALNANETTPYTKYNVRVIDWFGRILPRNMILSEHFTQRPS
jgi:hypothetical protein